MSEPDVTLIAAAVLAGLAMLLAAGLSGWREWIQLQREIAPAAEPRPTHNAGQRIELADLRERIRKLEAIAAGVDL